MVIEMPTPGPHYMLDMLYVQQHSNTFFIKCAKIHYSSRESVIVLWCMKIVAKSGIDVGQEKNVEFGKKKKSLTIKYS
jgi:hypothetical protein